MYRISLSFSLLIIEACDLENTSGKIEPGTPADTASPPCGAMYFLDSDGDHHGDPSTAICKETAPTGYVADDQDCDDTDSAVYPGASEICDDGVDQDCDGADDEPTWYYVDNDGDGYGNETARTYACELPAGMVSVDGDCDDTSSAINPGSYEYCDSGDVDEDCDGVADGADAAGASAWYSDEDGDGFGADATATVVCDAPEGAVDEGGDCDDDDRSVYPGAAEFCDGLANDCETRGSWTSHDEAGMASFQRDDDGEITDLTAAVSTTSGDVSDLLIEEDGMLRFCADPDAGTTWYVAIQASNVKLSVEGTQGHELTVLSGGGEATVMTFDTVDVELEGLTVQEGYSSSHGGALYATSTSISMDDMKVTSNAAVSNGGGIYVVSNSSLAIADSLIDRNSAGNCGGGIYLWGRTTADGVRGLTVSDNTSDYGGGICLGGQEASMTIGTGGEISNNEADVNGGGVYGWYSSLTLEDGAEVSANAAAVNGGGAYWYGGSLMMEDAASIDGNWGGRGGGVFLYASAVSLDGAMILANNATVDGGGLYLAPNSSTAYETIVACAGGSEVSGNTSAAGEGPGAYLGPGDDAVLLFSTDCTFADGVYVYDTDTTYDLSGTTAFTCDTDGCD